MKYEYTIFKPDSVEDILTAFNRDEPLPHIQIGHTLRLEIGDFSTKSDSRLVIQHVEVYLFDPARKPEPTIRIYIFLQERQRT
jgi:hypothetical protein